jgi:hypothetical protein
VLVRVVPAGLLHIGATDLVTGGVRRDPEDVVVVDAGTLPPPAAAS